MFHNTFTCDKSDSDKDVIFTNGTVKHTFLIRNNLISIALEHLAFIQVLGIDILKEKIYKSRSSGKEPLESILF